MKNNKNINNYEDFIKIITQDEYIKLSSKNFDRQLADDKENYEAIKNIFEALEKH